MVTSATTMPRFINCQQNFGGQISGELSLYCDAMTIINKCPIKQAFCCCLHTKWSAITRSPMLVIEQLSWTKIYKVCGLCTVLFQKWKCSPQRTLQYITFLVYKFEGREAANKTQKLKIGDAYWSSFNLRHTCENCTIEKVE